MAHQPQQLVATAISTTEITLSWADVDTLEGETYDIERDSVVVEEGYAGDHSVLLPYTDTGLDSDTEYVYRVRASGGTEASGVSLSTVTTASVVLTPVVFTLPTQIAGLAAWWDFSDISTLWQDTARTSAITTDAQVIKGVTDLSGNAKHLSEATNGPTYKTAIQNGRSIARFDGTNDRLAASITMTQPITVIVVCRPATIGADDTVFDTNPGNAVRLYRSNAANQAAVYSGTNLVSAGASFTVGSFYVVSGIMNGASSQARLNGVGSTGNAGSTAPGATSYLGVFGNGSSTPWHGDFAEVVIYDSALSTANHNLIGGYLAGKWGLTWTTI